ncbi:hypothetical protein [Methylomonas sp. DH-1]|uniref:hypothetical protein n=1 Tax=Methylomonas sp. (strain DH-1) TaxID=1727196 RepID=UPI0007C8A772|nr:hypothetical protein [Methylomonas sp. DH-1]ANE54456.1 hypothetical protein AYM39_04135 [Methylomonas sp. DH-1]
MRPDNLTGTPADVAAKIDAVVTSSGKVTKDNYPKTDLPQGDPDADSSQPHIDTLQAIAEGQHDGEDLNALLDKIADAALAFCFVGVN